MLYIIPCLSTWRDGSHPSENLQLPRHLWTKKTTLRAVIIVTICSHQISRANYRLFLAATLSQRSELVPGRYVRRQP